MSLSFTRGRIFLYLVDKKTNKIKEKIYYNDSTNYEKIDFEVENPLDVLNEFDYKNVKKKYRLSDYDLSQIKKYLKKKNIDKIKNNTYINVYNYLIELVEDRIKHSLIFDDTEYKQCQLLPAIKGYSVVSIIGPSGSGKSTLAAKIISINKKKDQKIYLLSRQINNNIDPAFKDFLDDIIEVDVYNLEDLPSLEDMENSFLLVDDIEGVEKKTRDYIVDYINQATTCGRKLGISIIFSAHINNGYIYKTIQSETRFLFMFPRYSSVRVKQNLRLKYGYTTLERNIILNNVKIDKSRYLCLHLNAPNSFFTEKRVVLE